MWNPKNKNYFNRNKREDAWKEISSEAKFSYYYSESEDESVDEVLNFIISGFLCHFCHKVLSILVSSQE